MSTDRRVGVWLVRNLAEALGDALAEFICFRTQLLVRELLDSWLQRVDCLDARQQALNLAFVLGAENFA